MTYTPPTEVDGVPVEAHLDDPHTFQGQRFVTLVPENEHDGRLWEFSLTTGRTYLMLEG